MQTYPSRYEIIESRVWIHAVTGARVSPYGAAPWTRESDRANWTLATVGYTVRENRKGTIGIGRLAFLTREQAQVWVNYQLSTTDLR